MVAVPPATDYHHHSTGVPIATNRNQHLVQRAYVEGFANADGGLLAFSKPKQEILNPRYPSQPSDILHRPNYYNDLIGDFDRAFNSDVESKFRHWYEPLAASQTMTSLDKDQFSYFIAWIANHLTRNQLLAQTVSQMRGVRHEQSTKQERATFVNRIRVTMFQQALKKYGRKGTLWRTMYFPVQPHLIQFAKLLCRVRPIQSSSRLPTSTCWR